MTKNEEKPDRLAGIGAIIKAVETFWGSELKFNLMTFTLEFKGKELDQRTFRANFLKETGKEVESSKNLLEACLTTAMDNSYHPFKVYLESLRENKDLKTVDLKHLAVKFFGNPNPYYGKFFEKWMIQAVARVIKPGCQADSMLILQSPKQGVGKTSFFTELFGEDFIFSNLSPALKPDDILQSHQSILVRIDEIDRISRKREASDLKDFISKVLDTVREPYAPKAIKRSRGFVFAGTTNKNEFLMDSTGNRRHWIIPVQNEKIPLETVRELRDSIFKTAYELFLAGEAWHFSDSTDLAAIADLTSQHEEVDPLESFVAQYVAERSEVTVQEIISNLPILNQSTDLVTSRRLSGILQALNFRQRTKKNGKSTVRVYERFTVYSSNDQTVNQTVTAETQTASDFSSSSTPVRKPNRNRQNPYTEGITADGLHFSEKNDVFFPQKIEDPDPDHSPSLENEDLEKKVIFSEQSVNQAPESLSSNGSSGYGLFTVQTYQAPESLSSNGSDGYTSGYGSDNETVNRKPLEMTRQEALTKIHQEAKRLKWGESRIERLAYTLFNGSPDKEIVLEELTNEQLEALLEQLLKQKVG